MDPGKVFAGKIKFSCNGGPEEECPIAVMNYGIDQHYLSRQSFLVFLRLSDGMVLRIFLYIDPHRLEEVLQRNMPQYWEIRADPLDGDHQGVLTWANDRPREHKDSILSALGVERFDSITPDGQSRLPSFEELWKPLSDFVLRRQSNLLWIRYLNSLQAAAM